MRRIFDTQIPGLTEIKARLAARNERSQQAAAEKASVAQVVETVDRLMFAANTDFKFSPEIFFGRYDMQQTPPHPGLMTSAENLYQGTDTSIVAVKFQTVDEKVAAEGEGRVFAHNHGAEDVTEIIVLAAGSSYPNLPKAELQNDKYSVHFIRPGIWHGSHAEPAHGSWVSIKFKNPVRFGERKLSFGELGNLTDQAETRFREAMAFHGKTENPDQTTLPPDVVAMLESWQAAQQLLLDSIREYPTYAAGLKSAFEARTAKMFINNGYIEIARSYADISALIAANPPPAQQLN